MLCAVVLTRAQITSWQGVINRYAPIVGYDACLNEIIVAPGSDIRVGDSVVIFCGKGAVVDTNKTPKDGTPAGAIYAGSIGVAAVADVQGTRVTLTEWLPPYWQALLGDVAQLVVIARAKNARISDIVRARPWNGTTGGIVAITVDETLFLDAPIDVSGYGYRGGSKSDNGADINQRAPTYPGGSGKAGYRGENVSYMSSERNTGKNFCMNGGGGGNARNAGGGGGGAFGPGGKGGKQTSEYDTMDIGGRGGFPMRWSRDQMHFGGGGGGGHQNDFRGGSGGNGGGIIIIRAKAIIAGKNAAVLARGIQGQEGAADGAGGGGGGGWIAITAEVMSGTMTVDASGGNGGEAVNVFECYGPGGGGGGGAILVSPNLTPYLTTNIKGGSPGVNRIPRGPCSMPFQSYEARPGNDGEVVEEFRLLNYGISPYVVVGIKEADTVVCFGTSSRVITEGGTAVWRAPASIAGRTDAAIDIPVNSDSLFILVDLTTPAGCVVTDSLVLKSFPRRTDTVTGPSQACIGVEVPFTLSSTWSTMNWTSLNGTRVGAPVSEPTASFLWTQTGIDTVTCTTTDTSGCTFTWRTTITIVDSLQPAISGVTRFCDGDSTTLRVLGTFAGVTWSTGATTDSIVVRSAGPVTVRVFDTLGCSGTSLPVMITVDPIPVTTLLTSASELADASDSLTITTDGSWSRYRWSTGDTTSQITVRLPGLYWVDVTSSAGCVGRSDTVEIRYRKIERLVRVTLPDTTGIPGQRIDLPVSITAVDSLLFPAQVYVRLRTDATMLVPTGTVDDFELDAPYALRTIGPIDLGRGFSSAMTTAEYTAVLGPLPVSAMTVDSLWSLDTTIVHDSSAAAIFTLNGYCPEQGGRFFDPMSAELKIVAYVDVLGRRMDPAEVVKVTSGPIFEIWSNGFVRRLRLASP